MTYTISGDKITISYIDSFLSDSTYQISLMGDIMVIEGTATYIREKE